MTKFVARIALMGCALAVMLGNYWYTFGLWPRSWWAFIGFGLAAIVVREIYAVVEKEK